MVIIVVRVSPQDPLMPADVYMNITYVFWTESNSQPGGATSNSCSSDVTSNGVSSRGNHGSGAGTSKDSS